MVLLMLLLLLARIVETRTLMNAVSLQLMIDQVVLSLATFPANVALRPCVRRRPVRVYVLNVLTEIARRRVASPAVTTQRPRVLVSQGCVKPCEILHRLSLRFAR